MKYIGRFIFLIIIGATFFYRVDDSVVDVSYANEIKTYTSTRQTFEDFLLENGYDISSIDLIDQNLTDYITEDTSITVDEVTFDTQSEEVVGTFNTIYQLSSRVPLFQEEIVQEGYGEGVTSFYEYKYINGNEVEKVLVDRIVTEQQDKIIAVGTGNPGSFNGTITGYGPDCAGCSGRVGCAPYPNVQNGNNYYNDSSFGSIRIVAADYSIPCGTIVDVETSILGTVRAIVLDRGNAINGRTMDLLFETEANLQYFGRRNAAFTIKRWGW